MNDDAAQREVSDFYPIGSMPVGGDGPESVSTACEYSSCMDPAGLWRVDLTIWPRPDTIDPEDASRHDAITGEIMPESSFAMTPAQARELAALIVKAAETVEFFQNSLND